MAELVADYILKRLREWGIHRIYGYPGDGINGFLGALDRADGDPERTGVREKSLLVSAHALCAVPNLRHLEYFHDHVRIESMLFEGVLEPDHGELHPDRSRPGHGLELKRAEAERFAA